VAGETGLHAKKKSLHAAEQERPDVRVQRDAWLDTLDTLDTLGDACAGDFARVIFLDESGAR
jgi:hypothetical protein